MSRRGLLALWLVACSSSAPGTVTVSPPTANVLTCSQLQLTASEAVTWSPNAPNGLYSAPLKTPAASQVQVTATSLAHPSESGTAQLTLATAFPTGPIALSGSTPAKDGLYQHWVVAKDQRVYAAWPVQTNGSAAAKVLVARSDDAGQTWQVPTTALATTMDVIDDTTPYVDCVSLAVDAANADVVYLFARLGGANALARTVSTGGGETTLVFAVSTNRGATFQPSVLDVDYSGVGVCGDVVSPAPATVVVEAPGLYGVGGLYQCASPNDRPEMYVWSDSNQGAAFATGTASSWFYVANGATNGLAAIQPDGSGCDVAIAQDGGQAASGGTSEGPRLFTDGSGKVCVTYVGNILTVSNVYNFYVDVQCSTDAGKTFSPLLAVSDWSSESVGHYQASGAFGPNGRAAIVWNQGDTVNGVDLYVATSTDDAKTFGVARRVPPYYLPYTTHQTNPSTSSPSIAYDANGILWIAYHVVDSPGSRVIVDKSWDDGNTWSGPVLVNGPEPAIKDMDLPTLLTTTGDAPRLMAVGAGEFVNYALGP